MDSCPVCVTLWLTLLIHGKRFQSDGLAWSRVQGADVFALHCCDQPSYLFCLFSGCASVMVALFVTSHSPFTEHTGHRHVVFSLSNVPCSHHCMPASHLFCSLLGCKLIAYVAWAIVGKTGRLQTVGQRFLLAGGGRDSLAQTSGFVNRGEKGLNINGQLCPG